MVALMTFSQRQYNTAVLALPFTTDTSCHLHQGQSELIFLYFFYGFHLILHPSLSSCFALYIRSLFVLQRDCITIYKQQYLGNYRKNPSLWCSVTFWNERLVLTAFYW